MSANKNYPNPASLFLTTWVAEHLNDANVRLFEVDVDTEAYERGHICCAAGVNWQTQLGDPIRRDNVSAEAWAHLLSEAGVHPETRLVFYGDNNNWFAAFAYWVTRIYRHDNVVLMNGGRKKWEREGRELSHQAAQIVRTTYPAQRPDLSLRAFLRDALAFAGAADGKALVDVRSPAEFKGEVIAPPGMAETAQPAGHIPGALNVPWAQAVNADGTFKSPDELHQRYGGRGITQHKDIVAYCRIGERSSHAWFVVKELLGFPNVRNYDGSWTEYGSVIGVPIDNPAVTA